MFGEAGGRQKMCGGVGVGGGGHNIKTLKRHIKVAFSLNNEGKPRQLHFPENMFLFWRFSWRSIVLDGEPRLQYVQGNYFIVGHLLEHE